ncbi:MAG TPA: hypothetical protein VE485_19095 [Mycobacterium sp.]|nr:hypothetical protein [Mycobacterium sp.]
MRSRARSADIADENNNRSLVNQMGAYTYQVNAAAGLVGVVIAVQPFELRG